MPKIKINEKILEGKTDGIISNQVIDGATFSSEPYKRTFTLNNFFFGPNGTGKTTIADTVKASAPSGYEICHFNQDYVTEMMTRVRTDDPKKKGLPAVFVLGSENKKIQEEVGAFLAEKKKQEELAHSLEKKKTEQEKQLTSELRGMEKKLLDLEPDVKNRFISKYFTSEERRTNDSICRVLENFVWDKNPVTFEAIVAHEEKEKDNVSAYLLYTLLDEYKYYDEAKRLISDPLFNKNNSLFAEFLKKIGATEWFISAHERFHEKTDGKCPYCGQELPTDFETTVEEAFDNTYKEIKDRIAKLKIHYSAETERLTIALEEMKEIRDASPAGAKLVAMTSLELMIDNLTKLLEKNIKVIDSKLDDSTQSLALQDYNELVREINEILKEENIRIEALNKNSKDAVWLKSEGKRLVCALFWTLHQKEIEAIKTKRNENSSIINNINQLISDANIAAANAQASADLKKKTGDDTRGVVEDINNILKKSGFTGFHIEEIDKDAHTVQVIRDSTGKPAIKLSEGEKNFIMFLYFYFSVRGGNENGTRSNKIVIIDDPVTSMDSQALFIISSLTKILISISCNQYDRSVGPTGEEYIHQFFLLTHNPVFFRNVTEPWIGNFEHNTYFIVKKIDNKSIFDYSVKPDESDRSIWANKMPTRSTYINMWTQFNEINNPESLVGVCRQIIYEYFINTCCYTQDKLEKDIFKDEGKNLIKVVNGVEDTSNLVLVRSLISFLSAKMTDDYYADATAISVEAIKEGLELVFKCTGHSQHFNEMKKIA